MPLTVTALGPFTRGAIAAANSSLDMRGAARHIRHGILSGEGRLGTGRGSEVAMTMKDDRGGTAVACTSVCAITPFQDSALVVAHSTITDKTYLYRCDAAFTGYYDAAGAFHAGTVALPVTALWVSQPDPPVVTIAELLGTAYIACTSAQTFAAQSFVTLTYTVAGGTAALTKAAVSVYAAGVAAFQGHLWIWGWKSGGVGVGFRPELLQHGGPDGGNLDTAGSGNFTVGHRVQSVRERIVAMCVAGEVAYVGTPYSLWPIVGYGRDTWDKSHPLDDSYGFLTVNGNVSANGVLYYWSPRGPARVSGLNRPEPLWDPLADIVPTIVDPHRIVAAYDADADQVLWYYRAGDVTGSQLIAAYDVQRSVMLGPDTDAGVQVACAGLIAPIVAADAIPSVTAPAPSGPPTGAFTFQVGASIAFAGWVNGTDGVGVTAVIELRQQGTATWISMNEIGGNAEGCALYGLTPNRAYEWRVAHRQNGQLSAWLGPEAATQFNTLPSPDDLTPPPPPPPIVAPAVDIAPPTSLSVTNRGPAHSPEALVRWVNSGEVDASTVVFVDGQAVGTFGPGVASAAIDVTASATYEFKVRHIKTGFDSSDFAGPLDVFIDDKP